MKKTLQTYAVLLKKFYDAHHRMPSYAELCDVFDCASKSTAYGIIDELAQNNITKKDEKGKIIPGKNFAKTASPLRVLGFVEAGFPSPAEEDLLETISLDEWVIGKRESTFMLKVKGDSMVDAGIHDGDMVIVERGKSHRQGDIVIAMIDGGFTMKYLRKNGSEMYLGAANKNYPDMYPIESLSIIATVVAVVRKY